MIATFYFMSKENARDYMDEIGIKRRYMDLYFDSKHVRLGHPPVSDGYVAFPDDTGRYFIYRKSEV